MIHGPTAGRRWEASAARKQLHHAAAVAGVRRRFAPHQLRHAHAVEMAHEGVPLVVIQRQLGHQPRHHKHRPARHRQQRNHQHRPRTGIADDLRQRRPTDQALAIYATWVGPASTGRPGGRTPGWRRPGRSAPLAERLALPLRRYFDNDAGGWRGRFPIVVRVPGTYPGGFAGRHHRAGLRKRRVAGASGRVRSTGVAAPLGVALAAGAQAGRERRFGTQRWMASCDETSSRCVGRLTR